MIVTNFGVFEQIDDWANHFNSQTSRSMSMFIFIRLSSIEDALDSNKRILCLNEVHEKAHNPLEYTK